MSIKNDILELFESQATLYNVMNIRNQYQDYLKKMYGIKISPEKSAEIPINIRKIRNSSVRIRCFLLTNKAEF